jgi:Ca2+-binding EF-hand superfamily protein
MGASEDLRELFAKYDLDGDGRIDREELRAALTEQRGKAPTDRSLDATLAALDDDGNGHIEFDEFVRAMTAFG